MSVNPLEAPVKPIIYPDSDGKPMADNTKQFEWIITIAGGLQALFADNPNVFVAGDLLWYPVEGDNKTRIAPDALVAFGRPQGYRGSYKQWEEGGVAPQAKSGRSGSWLVSQNRVRPADPLHGAWDRYACLIDIIGNSSFLVISY
jgi:hypothetical protein